MNFDIKINIACAIVVVWATVVLFSDISTFYFDIPIKATALIALLYASSLGYEIGCDGSIGIEKEKP